MDKVKKHLFLVALCCALVITCSFGFLQAQEKTKEQGQPRISFDATTYDAGEVKEGQEVSHDFIVKNTGTAELTISQVTVG